MENRVNRQESASMQQERYENRVREWSRSREKGQVPPGAHRKASKVMFLKEKVSFPGRLRSMEIPGRI